MKLVACAQCHAQYDVSSVALERFECRCGETVVNRDLTAVDATVSRCSSCGAIVGADAVRCDYCTSEIVRDRKGSLICPECYARNLDAARFCTACGIGFDPQSVPSEDVDLPCPSCGCLMHGCALDGISICECPSCHGLWAPGGRFERLIERAIETHRRRRQETGLDALPRVTGAIPTTQVVYRKCPVCEAHMHRSNFRRRSGVIIDVCHAHGTWLDADELEQIAGFILSGGLAEAQAWERAQADSASRREAAQAARSIQIGSPTASEGSLMTTVVELLQTFLR